jgi:restriction system protein
MAAARKQGFAAAFMKLLAVLPWSRRARRRARLAQALGERDDARSIHAMDREEFGQLVREGFRLQGFDIREEGRGTAAAGMDLVLSRGKDTFLVQCEHWRASKVGVEVVRDMHGAMATHGAAGGFVVTSGQFTEAARDFAEGRSVRLVDGGRLRGLLQQARDSISGAGASDMWVETRWPVS